MKRTTLLASTRAAAVGGTLVFSIVTMLASGRALAYTQYSQNKDATFCRACHGDFRASPYISKVDGASWGDDLHDVHRNTMLGGDCSVCHVASGRFPVPLDASAGGTGLARISCVGCHGRLEDASSGTVGSGAGLRQRHYRKGTTLCVSCHADSNPSNKTAVGENVKPPYYANPGTGHAAMPTDPCNPSPTFPENFKGTTLGLDNDGDLVFDQADSNCGVAAVCGNGTIEPGEQCDDRNTVNGDCCSSTCQFESSGSTCNDGLFCTVGETCNGSGACGGGAPRNCSDGIACTTDSCNETTDQCAHAPNDAVCSDGLFCNGVETCSATLGCQAGTAVNCDDGIACTTDSCNETTDQCAHAPNDAACSDGLFCNGAETCNVTLGCQAGTAVNCDDGIACTADSCNETTDQCARAPSDAACNDGLFCNGAETCNVTLGCQAGAAVGCDDGDVCTDDACNETADRCDHIYDPTNDPSCLQTSCGNGRVEPGEQCDDGNIANGDCCSATCQFESQGSTCNDGLFCTAGEVCNGAGACGNSTPRNCDDGVACTADSCNETADQCAHAPNDAACSDGLFCNGAETCSVTLGCQAGAAVGCDDGDICTDDACNETADRCDHVFDPTNDPSCASQVCGNGALDPGEQCDDGNQASGDCCSATCQLESQGSTCSDGLFCNAGETCNGSGTCSGGTLRSCDDAVACTLDSCDEASDRCAHAPVDVACSDGLFCNGVETCGVALGCVPGVPVGCDDGNACTDDACNEGTDACDHVFDRSNAPECSAQCPDSDGDGYSSAAVGCGPTDCDDSDAAVFPGAAESCTDDKDNDCDGLVDAADEACGGFRKWSVRPGPRADSAYAGSDACAGCHVPQYQTWSRSLHARMLIRPGDAQAAGFPLPDNNSVAGTTVSVTSWRDVLFVIGQKWSSLFVDRNGEIQPVQWSYSTGQWSPHPGGSYDCGACHTTGFDPASSFSDGNGRTVPGVSGAWVEYNIGCEACHGPGAEHAALPSRTNINRIALDWTPTGEGVRTPAIRSAEICGNCHYRNDHSSGLDAQRRNRSQLNDWSAGPHASSLEPTTLSTYCAKCHSPGNARADSEEHHFSYFDPKDATHVACVSCHDPHEVSGGRWANLAWPAGGQEDPKRNPAAIARYLGTDDNVATNDHQRVAPDDSNALCTGCHRMQPGFLRHKDASPPTVVRLHPPGNPEPFDVPHREHVASGNAQCVSCHMPYTRTSTNPYDLRTHTLRPNEWPLGGAVHYSDTCGQCHSQAQDCDWCHSGGDRRRAMPIPSGGAGQVPGTVRDRAGSARAPSR